jgi:hypothetical protein
VDCIFLSSQLSVLFNRVGSKLNVAVDKFDINDCKLVLAPIKPPLANIIAVERWLVGTVTAIDGNCLFIRPADTDIVGKLHDFAYFSTGHLC